MTMMSDLSQDLVEEILSRVLRTSLGAVRSTCKLWNRLSKNRILCNAGARHQILGFSMMDNKLYSMRFNLHGIGQDGEEFIDPSIKPIGNNNILDLVEISKVFYCDGLILLCVTKDDSRRLVVWNPYLGQTSWIRIQRRNDYHMDATYALGYDNNKNHKISRFFFDHRDDQSYYQTYDLNYNSWSLRHAIPNWAKYCYEPGVSVNGNTYFRSYGRMVIDGHRFIVSFDFTTETFGHIADLPFREYVFMDNWSLSCVREEKLAVLYQCWENTIVMEIWMTIKIEPNAASWSKFLRVDMEPIGFDFEFDDDNDSFFIDEEKKVVVIFSLDDESETSTAYIIGDNNNRYLKTVDLEKVAKSQESVEIGRRVDSYLPLMCSSSYYVPSLVQINQITGRKRKQKKIKRKHKRKDEKSKRTNKPVPGKKKTNY